ETNPDAIGSEEALPALPGARLIAIEPRDCRHLLFNGSGEGQEELILPRKCCTIHIIEARGRVPLVHHTDHAVGLVAHEQAPADAVCSTEQHMVELTRQHDDSGMT